MFEIESCRNLFKVMQICDFNSRSKIDLEKWLKLCSNSFSSSISTVSKYMPLFRVLFSKDANCEEAPLNQAVKDIENSINETSTDINLIKIAKTNTRKTIDCHPNDGDKRKDLFDHYEGLCKRMVILKSVYEDLLIKKEVIKKEITRCSQRSK